MTEVDPPMQIRYIDDMWKFLACHIALNQATGRKAREVMPEFFSRFPDYRAVGFGNLKEMIEILSPLGMQNMRADRLLKLAMHLKMRPDLKGIWKRLDHEDILEMPGMGKYAADSYMCFVRGEKRLARYDEPLDKEIWKYLEGGYDEHAVQEDGVQETARGDRLDDRGDPEAEEGAP